jgi:hypothetical protein
MTFDVKDPWMLCFSRNSLMRFISHLDWLEMAERILVRAGLPFVYSEGYRPRIVMKGSPPLPIGVESKCELLQIFLRDVMDPKDVARRLMHAVPQDIEVDWVSHMRFKPAKNPYNAIVAAEYMFRFKEELSMDKRQRIVALIESLKPGSTGHSLVAGPDADILKPVANRVLEIVDADAFLEGASDEINLIGKMDPNETLHAAKLGFFLYETAPLARYPRIVKMGYLRNSNGVLEPVFRR